MPPAPIMSNTDSKREQMTVQVGQRRVDRSAFRTNQAFIIGLLILAFVLNSVPLVAFVAAVMLLGTAVPQLALFQGIYRRLLRPAGLVKADVIVDNPEPHRFAQGFGGSVLVLVGHLALGGAVGARLGARLVGGRAGSAEPVLGLLRRLLRLLSVEPIGRAWLPRQPDREVGQCSIGF